MPKIKKILAPTLTIGAIGVVFGDIGTSPLYALQTVFSKSGGRVELTRTNVYGIVSLIIWAIILVVSVKFIGCIMKADNEGEGGIMALIALVRNSKLRRHYKWIFITLGLVGVSLFYGDSAITPAISVLSAVEGLKVVAPHLNYAVVPLTLLFLVVLFWFQRYGTSVIGWVFGPLMLVWFIVIGIGGLLQIWHYPDILGTLLPWTAISFFIHQPFIAFISLTAVVLAITGVEALYADMGHFGREPIARAWFWVVFPALVLCYMGEGALITNAPSLAGSILVQLFPAYLRVGVVIIATIAALIASQAVISGVFSLTSQAVRLRLLPRMLIRHTSIYVTGQIYMPFINFLLFTLVIALVIGFGSSTKLAGAYGIAVSGTIAVDTVLFLVVMRTQWRKSVALISLAGAAFLVVDLLFVASNLQKLLHGGLLPVAIGCLVFILFDTWLKGERIIDAERQNKEKPLNEFIDKLHNGPDIKRIPGAAVYIGHHSDYTPLALNATVSELHELPEKVAIVTVETSNAAHVPADKRAILDTLDYNDGITHLKLSYGYHDTVNIPKALESLRGLSPELNFDPYQASYFISQSSIAQSSRHNMYGWQKALYRMMQRSALNASDYYKLPIDNTEVMQTLIKL